MNFEEIYQPCKSCGAMEDVMGLKSGLCFRCRDSKLVLRGKVTTGIQFIDRYHCECGKTKGRLHHNTICDHCKTVVIFDEKLDELYYLDK